MSQRQGKVNIWEISRALEKLTLSHQRTEEAIRKLSLEVEIRKRGYSKNRDNKPNIMREQKLTKEKYEHLIRSRVRIINPGKDEPNIGYVHSVGKIYITIEIPGGIKKQRIAKILRLFTNE